LRSGKGKIPGSGILAGILIFWALVWLAAWATGGLDPEIDMGARLLAPGPGHPLGTDDLGRDLLGTVACAHGLSMVLGLVVAAGSLLIGGLAGMVAGWCGGRLDGWIMRAVDLVLAFPGFILAIGISACLDPGWRSLVAILVFCGWPGYARLVRVEVMKFRTAGFVLAALSYNASGPRIACCHLLPHVLPFVMVQASQGVGEVILAETGLNFLGVGLGPTVPSLGVLISMGMDHLFDRPHLLIFPGLMLVSLVFFFILLAHRLHGRLAARGGHLLGDTKKKGNRHRLFPLDIKADVP